MTEQTNEIIRRLRAMGRAPGDEGSDLDLSEMSSRRRAPWLAAAAVLALVLVSTAAFAVGSSSGGEGDIGRIDVTVASDGEEIDDDQTGDDGAPGDPFPDDLCQGPPPFAGQDPGAPGPDAEEGAQAQRQQESDDFEAFKAENCTDDPDDGTGAGGPPELPDTPAPDAPGPPVDVPPDSPDDGLPVDPFPDDDCKGPPPFAGQVPASPEERAAEAEALEQWKAANCSEDAVTGSPQGGPLGPGGE
jgi:hypothetical protein